MLGNFADRHLAGLVQLALDADERDSVRAGDSTKAHSDEPSGVTMRARRPEDEAGPSQRVTMRAGTMREDGATVRIAGPAIDAITEPENLQAKCK